MISSAGESTSTARMSTRGTRISCTVMSSNSITFWIISVSCWLSTPSSSTVSMMVLSSASVTLGLSSPPRVASFCSWANRNTTGFRMVLIRVMGRATASDTFSELVLAKLLGMISPKISTRMVTTTVATTGPVCSPSRVEQNTVASEEADRFTTLLPTRMEDRVRS